jgi:hypothetical protein
MANAGPNQLLVSPGQLVQLDGSGSSDPNGDLLTFQWALTTRPAGSQATLTNATQVNPTFVADIFDTYVAQLIVNDGTLTSLPATVTITPNLLPPLANAGPDQSLVVSQLVQLDGSGSSDPNGDPLTFQWSFVTRPPRSNTTLANATTAQPTFRSDLPGTYVVQLIVNDGIAGSAPDTVTITANLRTPRFAYVANQTLDSISRFAIDATTGALTELVPDLFLTDTSNTVSPIAQAVTVDPLGRFAYVADDSNAFRVFGFTINAATGALTPITGSPFAVAGRAQAVAVDPSGRFAYVVTIPNPGPPPSGSEGVSVFTINAVTGALYLFLAPPSPQESRRRPLP